MDKIPMYIGAGLMLTTLLSIYIFYRAANKSNTFLIIVFVWIALQSIIALTGFYTVTDTIPPRFALLLLPPLIFITRLFATTKGRTFIDGINLKWLTILHIVRIPVELILVGLYTYKTIPQLMTFEGRNFDILSGLTAPVVFYFGFVKNKFSANVMLFWNYACLILLANIVINAILSAPFNFQQFAFDQPNIALLYFPFIWLPSCIVPLVLFSQLATIRQLRKEKILAPGN